MDYHNILSRLQKYIKTNDVAAEDIPLGIEFFCSGNVYVPSSFSIKKVKDINEAFEYIDKFLKDNNS